MLRSMTGQGHATQTCPLGTFTAELRTVNHRGYKLNARLNDALGTIEPKIDRAIRTAIQRGTVQLTARWQRTGADAAATINAEVITSYFQQLDSIRKSLGTTGEIDLARLATLPGALQDRNDEPLDEDGLWEAFEPVLQSALQHLNAMRDAEGAAMQRQLETDLAVIEGAIEAITKQAPQVVAQYQKRLRNKIAAALHEEGIPSETPDVIREVQIFADRSDISEELTRLASHIDLFRQTIVKPEANGRKLDFVIQEMLRETNTIGSKAGDAEIAHHVVEVKCALERMRELVQNIE